MRFSRCLLRNLPILLGMLCPLAGCEPPPLPVNSPRETNSTDSPAGMLVEVEITGFENNEGRCRVAAYEKSSGFQDPNHAVARNVLPIEGNSVRWSFTWQDNGRELSPAGLAISAYHDQNDNGQLDKSLIGIPTERYGFSNNPKRGYGPPKFDQALIAVPKDASRQAPWRIEITIQ
ncbi:MAG: DUF2141 domain-containing protein [Planctomycetota bacterium]